MEDDNNQYKVFAPGEVIIAQGEAGDSAYYIEEGAIEVLRELGDGTVYKLGTRGPGTFIGEMALIDRKARTATVKAIEECHLIEVTRADFERRLQASDSIVRAMIRVILTRYRDMLTRIQIMENTAGLPTPELIERELALEDDALATLKLEKDFQKALHNDELFLVYQPIIDLASGRLQGFEALLRWQHPEYGYISPDSFISMAEETGLIIEAGKWVLEQACRTLRAIEDCSGDEGEYYMSVNFTGEDFAQADFLTTLQDTVARYNIKPSAITLEITERMLIDDPENARHVLQECRDAGFRIALDDFGIGYSSLSYLHYFPLDMMKIDKAFVQDMCHNESAYVLIRSIIALGRSMNMTVLGEGVETGDEARELAGLGCEKAQGFYYAKPLTAEQLRETPAIYSCSG